LLLEKPNILYMQTVNTHDLAVLLEDILLKQLTEKARDWFEQQVSVMKGGKLDRKFFMAFSSAPRFVGKSPLSLSADQLEAIQSMRSGLRPDTWNMAEAVRIVFILQLPSQDAQQHKQWIQELFDTADMGEQVAIFAAFPLLPFPEQYQALAAEGIRTNMTVVLEAIALHNPYPAAYLSDNAWNQLYLKCVFTDRALYKIQGVDERANAELARIVSDYAHERWSAGRVVSPEMWRPVSPFMNETLLADIAKVFQLPDPTQQAAAALTCHLANMPAAKSLLAQYPEWEQSVEAGELSWEKIGKDWENREM